MPPTKSARAHTSMLQPSTAVTTSPSRRPSARVTTALSTNPSEAIAFVPGRRWVPSDGVISCSQR